MKIDDVKRRAFAMPLTSPAFPSGPYRFVNREFLIITYRTDPDALREVVPEPLQFTEPLVKYEFIRAPSLTVEKDTLLGTLDHGSVRVATATMGFKHRQPDPAPVLAAMLSPNYHDYLS
jgi:acetoacetate decarboxylase